MRRSLSRLARSDSGAVAPIVALSLVGLIASAGIAFDYAQLASLDTELQQAADQAALAGATQLDGTTGALERATAAAQVLLTNETRFANDGNASGRAVTVPTVVFYQTRADAEGDTNGFTDVARFKDARFVRVAIATRRARYALTPIVGLVASPNLGAEAVAGLGSAICKVPPLMMCNPQETGTNKNFDLSGYVGRGMLLVAGGGGGSWAPGNFGYLNTGTTGANALEYSLGANNPPGNCLALDGVTTKPGENTSVVNAINTRFDIYQNGLVNDCSTGNCSPSPNVRKDVVRPEGTTSNCGFATGSDPWDLPPAANRYLPDPTTGASASSNVVMGHPRDICHSVSQNGNCANGRIGNGTWDRNLYFFSNHRTLYPTPTTVPNNGWQSIPSLVTFANANSISDLSKITRYQVYRWEIDNNLLGASPAYPVVAKNGKTTNFRAYGRPVCGPALPASSAQLDRRLTAMAVVNCAEQNVQGSAQGVAVTKWVEVFFVEPSIARDRTSAGDVYVEVVRVVDAGASASTSAQVIRRDVPYLVK